MLKSVWLTFNMCLFIQSSRSCHAAVTQLSLQNICAPLGPSTATPRQETNVCVHPSLAHCRSPSVLAAGAAEGTPTTTTIAPAYVWVEGASTVGAVGPAAVETTEQLRTTQELGRR